MGRKKQSSLSPPSPGLLEVGLQLVDVLLVVGDGGLQRVLGSDLLVSPGGGPQQTAHLRGQPAQSSGVSHPPCNVGH